MKQGRRGRNTEENKPETLQKVFKQGFVQRKGSIFACTSLHEDSPCKRHQHQAEPHVAGFILHWPTWPVSACCYLDNKAITSERG